VSYKNADNRWTVIGIVSYDSFLSECRNESSPRAFIRISSYLDWIVNITNDGNFIPSPTAEIITTITSPYPSMSSPIKKQESNTNTFALYSTTTTAAAVKFSTLNL
jgi:secreted trypsin-like serine protease